MKYKIFLLLILITIVLITMCNYIKHKNNFVIEDNKITQLPIQIDTLPLTKENVYYVLDTYDIKFPNIVYKQMLLETGHFKSRICLENNNLLGIYYKGNFLNYEHWSGSIKSYKKIQTRYNYDSTHTKEHYYNFLIKIGYAEDPEYINKLKNIKL